VLADAQRLLPFYETFFGTRYPMPKLDIVVTDGALQSALEGWGAITFYSEGSIFGQQFFGGMPGRREAVEELAHEMAHQWVGDLVDMRWSRDTFVAEGLAEYAQQRAVAALYPELQSPIDDDRQVEYVIDAGVTAGTVPVVGPVATDLERDDDKTFSVAAYYKGADIVRQWQLLIGDAAFRSGIARYLRTHRDGSATFEDFWKAFRRPQAVSYGDSWLTHPGFPLVDVGITCRNGRSTVDVTQEAFVSDPVIGSAYRRQLWQFPLSVTIAGAEHMLAVPATHHTRFALRGCGVEAIDDTFRPYARILYRGDALRGLAQRSPRERRRFFEDYAAI
jgi:aminopeptidase N